MTPVTFTKTNFFFAFVEICHEKIGPCKIRTISETMGVQSEVENVNREYAPFLLTSGQYEPNTVIFLHFYHIGQPFKSSPLLGLIGGDGCCGGGGGYEIRSIHPKYFHSTVVGTFFRTVVVHV